MQITVFTLGYMGWGRAGRKFLEAIDAVEQSRGFQPPFFVDVRITRSARSRLGSSRLGSGLVSCIKACLPTD
jgi:hypothetical protein